MTSSAETGQESRPQQHEPFILRLYVAGRAPNSVRAIANLRLLCEEYFPDRHKVEIIDVLEDPLRAITDDILATPTLVKVSPGPERKIIGNLSEKSKVLNILGLGDGIP